MNNKVNQICTFKRAEKFLKQTFPSDGGVQIKKEKIGYSVIDSHYRPNFKAIGKTPRKAMVEAGFYFL